MVKQPAMEANEFTMSNEDFPALPGPGPNQAGAGPPPSVPNAMEDLGAVAVAVAQVAPPQAPPMALSAADLIHHNEVEQPQPQQQQPHLQQVFF